MKDSINRWTVVLGLGAIAVLVTAVMTAAVSSNATEASAGQGDAAAVNRLTDEEKKAGWKLLFDGESLQGWHNFKQNGIRPGWKLKDGTIACVDPKNAGDLVTTDKYDWFELSIEYNISEAGNSGIMFHVTDDGPAIWATGPEVQLEDNKKARDPERSGWLYQLYKPAIDPKTQRRIDATKPVGEWNHLRIVIAPPPAKSEVVMNGVKYYDFVYGSDDFKARIAKSKFRRMPLFAKSDSGYLGLQGDHGAIAFRNIKLRPIGSDGRASQPTR